MSNDLNAKQNTISARDFQLHFDQVLDEVAQTGHSVLVLRDEMLTVAVVEISEFQRLQNLADQIDELRAIIQAEHEFAEGKSYSLEEMKGRYLPSYQKVKEVS